MGKRFTQDSQAFILPVTFIADNCLHHVLLPVVEERGGGGGRKGGGGDQLDRFHFLGDFADMTQSRII